MKQEKILDELQGYMRKQEKSDINKKLRRDRTVKARRNEDLQ